MSSAARIQSSQKYVCSLGERSSSTLAATWFFSVLALGQPCAPPGRSCCTLRSGRDLPFWQWEILWLGRQIVSSLGECRALQWTAIADSNVGLGSSLILTVTDSALLGLGSLTGRHQPETVSWAYVVLVVVLFCLSLSSLLNWFTQDMGNVSSKGFALPSPNSPGSAFLRSVVLFGPAGWP